MKLILELDDSMHAAGGIDSTKIKRLTNGTMDNDGQILMWIHIAKF